MSLNQDSSTAGSNQQQVSQKETEKDTNQAEVTDRTSVYSLYNPYSHEHLYTKDTNEYNTLITKHGWQGEGEKLNTPTESSEPVYRLYDSKTGNHHYAYSDEEYAEMAGEGWNQEGVAFYEDDANTRQQSTDTTKQQSLNNPNALMLTPWNTTLGNAIQNAQQSQNEQNTSKTGQQNMTDSQTDLNQLQSLKGRSGYNPSYIPPSSVQKANKTTTTSTDTSKETNELSKSKDQRRQDRLREVESSVQNQLKKETAQLNKKTPQLDFTKQWQQSQSV